MSGGEVFGRVKGGRAETQRIENGSWFRFAPPQQLPSGPLSGVRQEREPGRCKSGCGVRVSGRRWTRDNPNVSSVGGRLEARTKFLGAWRRAAGTRSGVHFVWGVIRR